MPIKLGTTGFSSIYNGANNIISVYKGTDLIFNKNNKSPLVQLIEKTIEVVDSTMWDESRVTDIRDYCFRYCSKLKRIKMPSALQNIGSYAFAGCSSLVNIELPSKVSMIDIGCFQDCTKLETINIPEGVTTIWSNCFQNCISLKDLTLPSSVTQLNDYAFQGCSSMKTLTLLSTSVVTLNTLTGDAGTLSMVSDETTTIYVPSSLVEQYKSDAKWSLYLTREKNPVTFVGI